MVYKLWKIICLKSWWVVTFGLFCAILYEHGLYKRELYYQQLNLQMENLKKEKQFALEKNDELQRLVHSQEDSQWVELILREKLGLIADGEQKVVFVD